MNWTLKLRTFRKDARGNVALISAFMMASLIVSIGGAVDCVGTLSDRSDVQAALDAAVLAAASHDGGEAARMQIASDMFNANLIEPLDAATMVISINEDDVTATAEYDRQNRFLGLIQIPTFQLQVGASASIPTPAQPSPCIISLAPNGTGISLNSKSKILAPGCRVMANSTAATALSANSSSRVSAQSIGLSGSYKLSGGSTATPTPETSVPAVADPLAALPVPAQASQTCKFTDKTVNSGTSTLSPGVYCKKLILNSGANVTFQPGIYILRDALFEINSGSKAVGDGVFFYLMGSGDYLKVNSDSTIQFKAPRSGPYKGVAFFQERKAQGDPHILNSNSSSFIEGVVYFPKGTLMLNSGGSAGGGAAFTSYVVDRLDLNSDSVLTVNANYAATDVPLPDGMSGGSFGETIRLLY